MKSFKSYLILATVLAIATTAFASGGYGGGYGYYKPTKVFGKPRYGPVYYVQPNVETKGSGHVHADYNDYGGANIYMKNKAYTNDGYYPSGYGQNWQDVKVWGDDIYAAIGHDTKAKANAAYYPLKYEATDKGSAYLGTGGDSYAHGRLWGDGKSSFNQYGMHAENKVYGNVYGEDGYIGAHGEAKNVVDRDY